MFNHAILYQVAKMRGMRPLSVIDTLKRYIGSSSEPLRPRVPLTTKFKPLSDASGLEPDWLRRAKKEENEVV